MLWELPNIRGTLFWAHNKDPTVLEIFLGSPIFGNSHINTHKEGLCRL